MADGNSFDGDLNQADSDYREQANRRPRKRNPVIIVDFHSFGFNASKSISALSFTNTTGSA